MEVLKTKIEKFLAISSGSSNGYGSDSGSGDGYGYGNGCGDDYGSSDGSSYGCGYGNGCGPGYGISEINGMQVLKVDNVPTIITNIHGNIAEGYTLQYNVNLVPCYIAKVGNCFSHGKTAHQAMQDAQEKYEQNKPLSERIADIVAKYPTLDTVVSHTELYALHHTLTGSCKYGRDEFAKAHDLDPEQGEMTMRQFINLTIDAYGGDAIKELLHAYTTTF